MKSAHAIAFDHRPSRQLMAAVALVSSSALAALLLSGLAWWLKIVLALAAIVYAALALQQFLRAAPRRLVWHSAGHWRIVCRDGEHTAEVRSAIVRGAWIVLNLRRSDRRHTAVVLAADNCDDETHRRLRVRLSRVADVQPVV